MSQGLPLSEEELRDNFPSIEWDVPIKVTVLTEEPRFCCRYCIAMEGLQGSAVKEKGGTFAEIEAHIEKEHQA